MKRALLILSLLIPSLLALPKGSTQAIVGVASSWDSSHVTLSLYEKKGNSWVVVAGPFKGRLGKNGLAWGKGLHQLPSGAKIKKEGDFRAPAGIFPIGGAWGYAQDVQRHPKQPYRRITTRDLWVEDSKSPSYNRHVVLPHEPKTTWEKQQQMRQNDHAHSLKLYIGHNNPPKATPGAGSAIFFHIWRSGGAKSTAGCTTVPEARLKSLVSWIDPTKQPVYVLLPKKEVRHLPCGLATPIKIRC